MLVFFVICGDFDGSTTTINLVSFKNYISASLMCFGFERVLSSVDFRPIKFFQNHEVEMY